MTEHRLIIPAPVLPIIQGMRYTGQERIEYYLSREVDSRTHIDTLVLVRLPMGTSSGLTVTEDREFISALGRYLDLDQTNSAVLLHFHPLRGPSAPDEALMSERFGINNRLSRYGIFVGPEGPVFYETDGREVFPIRSQLATIPLSPEIRNLQQQVLDSYQNAFRQR